ncbi:MAG: NAD(P)H-hydrate epimerase [Sedimentisphaerales bacterium]
MERYSPDKKFVSMTKEQVRAVDSWAINTIGIPGVVLMENAGRSCAELIKDKLKDIAHPKVCIFCGTGNNGGDGYVIARHLLSETPPQGVPCGTSYMGNSGFEVIVVICGDREKVKGDAKINLDILERLGLPIEQLNLRDGDVPARVKAFAADADMLVDGLFGTGLSGQLSDDYKQLIESINACNCPILAVDIPSGLDCDSGQPLGAAIRANYTVTFVAVKKGFASKSAVEYTGEIFVASIGVEPDSKCVSRDPSFKK